MPGNGTAARHDCIHAKGRHVCATRQIRHALFLFQGYGRKQAPTGSIKIRVETISYFLKRYREEMARRKQKQAEIDAKLKEFQVGKFREID